MLAGQREPGYAVISKISVVPRCEVWVAGQTRGRRRIRRIMGHRSGRAVVVGLVTGDAVGVRNIVIAVCGVMALHAGGRRMRRCQRESGSGVIKRGSS